MYGYPPPPFGYGYPQQPIAFIPPQMPQSKPRKLKKRDLAQIKDMADYLQTLLKGDKKEEKKDDKNKIGVVEKTIIFSFASPFVGILFSILFMKGVIMMADAAKDLAAHFN